MPKDVLNGILLRVTDYRESDRILNILTRERGLVAVVARGCRKANSKYAVYSSQFTFGEIEVSEMAGKLRLASANAVESFYPIRESYEQLLSATHVVYAAEHISRGDIPNDELFVLLYNALSLIAYGDNDPRDIELAFMAKMIKLCGYAPTLTSCVKCGRDLRACRQIRFSNSLGGSVCERCGSAFAAYSTLALEALRRMMLLDTSDMRRVRLPDGVREELYALIYNYAEYIFEFTLKR